MVDTVFRTELPGWHARIEAERELGAAGTRNGVEYTVGLISDGAHQTTKVCAFFADDISDAGRADRKFQREAVLRAVFARLETGWTPADGALPPLIIAAPPPGYRHPGEPRQSFMDRVLGRPRP